MLKTHGPFFYEVAMRDFINTVLAFIGTSSLTNDEYEEIDLSDFGYNIPTFDVVKMLLFERDEATETSDRLKLYFMAKGVNVEGDDVTLPAKSNIFIGAAL